MGASPLRARRSAAPHIDRASRHSGTTHVLDHYGRLSALLLEDTGVPIVGDAEAIPPEPLNRHRKHCPRGCATILACRHEDISALIAQGTTRRQNAWLRIRARILAMARKDERSKLVAGLGIGSHKLVGTGLRSASTRSGRRCNGLLGRTTPLTELVT